MRFDSKPPATDWVRFDSGAAAAASGGAQAVGQRRVGSSGDAGSLRRRSVDPESRTRRRDAIDPTYDYTHQFEQVETTGYKLYCGYGSIANYVKFLPVDERMAFYEKLFKDTDENNAANRLQIFDDKGNITDESRDELLILEIFLTLRENATLSSGPNEWPDNDKSLYERATKTYQKKIRTKEVTVPTKVVKALDYDDFIKKYKIVDAQNKNFKLKSQHSYQTWIAEFLRNKLQDLNGDLQLDLQLMEDDTQQNMSLTNLFSDQKIVLFNFYFPEESNATCNAITNSDTKITNPEVANKDLFWFHKSIIEAKDGSECEENKKLFYEVYDYFLTKYKLAGHSPTAKYKHFYKKENYDTFCATEFTAFSLILNEVQQKKEDRRDLGEFIFEKAKVNGELVLSTFIKVTEHFQREFSFEKQFLNLLHSDTFLTHASGSHYTTMVPKYKINNPFPDNNSNLGVEDQFQLSDNQQNEIQKKNVEEAFKSAKIDSPTPPIPPAPQAPIPAYGDNIHLRQDGHLHHYKAQKQVV